MRLQKQISLKCMFCKSTNLIEEKEAMTENIKDAGNAITRRNSFPGIEGRDSLFSKSKGSRCGIPSQILICCNCKRSNEYSRLLQNAKKEEEKAAEVVARQMMDRQFDRFEKDLKKSCGKFLSVKRVR